MSSPDQRLRAAVESAIEPLRALSESQSAKRPEKGGWSRREILGHLIDSAANNHRRFVLAQTQADLVFPGYEQETWVRLQGYQDASWAGLLTLWETYNLHLAHVMASASAAERERPRARHNLHEIAFKDVPSDQPPTLDWLMHDYVDHLRHHLQQALSRG